MGDSGSRGRSGGRGHEADRGDGRGNLMGFRQPAWRGEGRQGRPRGMLCLTA